ncbi:hypothetical protein O4H66_27745 [Comamonadaceae bacterium G21597-S1]|nr:hypothetical protein [Comamonadaceae bacterium G21597-S1]
MPLIAYGATNFKPHWGPLLAGAGLLTVTWQELVWAAITVGKPGVAHLLAHGWHSVSDNIVRSHMVYASLRQSSGQYEKSSLYGALDPTEKGATSYFMGMMAAKVLAARLLDTPWLFHLSMFRASGGILKLHTNSEPDLIGRTAMGGWVVMEAKGRTHGRSDRAMTAAKTQTRQLRRINGQFPVLRAAVQAYFQPEMRFAIDDPEEYEENAEDLNFNVRSAVEKYYSGFLRRDTQMLRDVSILGRRYIVQDHEEVGISVGVDSQVLERLAGANDDALLKPLAEQANQIEAGGPFTIFPDGVALALDKRWSEPRMMRDPALRRNG